MPFSTVHQESLISLSSIMNDNQSVFIIPTFQRPFAWEEKQLQDLQEDINKTKQFVDSNLNNIHYLAPIHLIPLKANEITNQTLRAYLPENEDIDSLLTSLNDQCTEFINNNYDTLKVFFVIDGQQRLTTLYFVYQFIYSNNPSNPLNVILKDGREIPRLIQNPTEDHYYFSKLRNNLYNLNTLFNNNTQAQKRMLKAVEHISTWNDWKAVPLTNFAKFLKSSVLKTLLIELEPNYGLTSFQTLNDRGKNLTSLEKFKSLLLEYALNAKNNVLAHSIHNVFSKLYQVIDEGVHSGLFPESEAGDNRLIQYLFVYIKICENANNYWQSGANAYSELRKELIESSDPKKLLKDWLKSIKEVCDQLIHLNNCLLGKETSVNNPSFICQGRTIKDDYNILINSLKLSSRSIAVLLRFRALFKSEWHDRFPINCSYSADLFKPLSDFLVHIKGTTDNSDIHRQIHELQEKISFFDDRQIESHYSMLEAVERMELTVWQRYNPQGTFRDNWIAVFDNINFTAKDAVISWYNWYHKQNGFPRFVQDDESDSVFRYILREYEAFLNNGICIHFDKDLTLEHIFPQNPVPIPPANYGFGNDPTNYYRFLNRIGNLTFVYKNEKLSNQLPYIKASQYLQPMNVKEKSKIQPKITLRVANQLRPLTTDFPAYQNSLKVRCCELALFSIKRFFC